MNSLASTKLTIDVNRKPVFFQEYVFLVSALARSPFSPLIFRKGATLASHPLCL
jgi:hypothetical protein